MSHHEIINRRANLNGRSNDSDESIMLDTASKELKDILGNDDISSIVVSSILSNNEDQNKGFHVNDEYFALTSRVNGHNVEDITVEHSNETTLGNKIIFEEPVIINVYRNDDSYIEEEATYHHDDEPMLPDSSEIDTTSGDANVNSNVNKMHCFRKKQLMVLAIVGVFIGIAAYFISHIFVIHAQSYEKQRTDSNKFDFTQGYQLTTVEFQVDGIKRNDSSDNVKYTTSKFPVITRSEWGAQNSKNTLANLQLPAIRVIIAHTGTGTCLTQASCSSMIRSMQLSHFRRGWDDIGYNFLVGGDGSAYIGRGWDKQGAHSRSYNPKSICIAFIGTFNEIFPPQRQIAAAQKLIEEGLLSGKLAFHYRLYGHHQVIATDSPGDALYAIIKKWDHWSEIII